MMTIKLKDRTEVVVTNEQGQKVQESILNDAQFIKLNGQLYSRSSIDQVVNGGEAPKPFVDPFSAMPKLPSGKLCRGQHSIQAEINNLAKSEHPDDWAKKIVDPMWREETRQRLLELRPEWCDYKTSSCYCGMEL